ncbi:sulfite exporter TauE/SafE family protein 5-like [Hibiscus syriacus]|uniref:sulfite exporter TauE/SafE family protein 5-like n=1 Tax=Hibiscus syriacus TaxID=106335 RepID=UPI001921DD00|nr:sulfite exporter TauE/SafE family protein 5-like [Hibiscus syriacus]
MKNQSLLRWISLTLTIFILLTTQSQSHATTQTQPIVDNPTIDSFINRTLQWRRSTHQMSKSHGNMKLSTSSVVAGVLSFMAASISSAGGVGGGGLFIPILTILGCVDLKTATSFSALMVTGGSIANVMYNLLAKSAKSGGKTLIDYDIALLSEPCMLLGVSVGVVCNLVLPEWLITIMFAIFLVWSTIKTCSTGVEFWKLESGRHLGTRNGYGNLENGESGEAKSLEEPLVSMERKESHRFPWKMVLLIMIWFSFFIINLLRGSRYGQGVIPLKPCGIEYWALSLFQIPLALTFTAWILRKQEPIACQAPNKQGVKKLIFPLMALMAGGLGGLFGIGGGMLISPLLLQVGLAPEASMPVTCPSFNHYRVT